MIDLLQYITSRYPESIRNIRVHKSGNWQSIRAVWRGDKIASCGIKWYGDRWRFNDYATGQHGDVVDFLVQVEGYDKAEALKIATGGAGFSKPAKVSAQKPELVVEQPLVSVSERTRKFANQCVRDLRRDGVPAVWSKRGFSMADCVKLKLGRNGNDGVFPILRGKKLVNLKIRLANTERGKYRYAEPGHGSPAWYSPNLETADAIILLEGELNAMAVWLSMSEQYGVIGMAGASQPVTSSDLEAINGRPVYVMADDDQAGRDAALRWCSQVDSSIGILRPFGKQDACDIHAVYGKKILSGRILTRILELNKTRKSGRDGAVRSWLSPAESVRDRSISIARSTSAARLSPLPTPLSKGIEYICRAFPELRRYAIRLGKNVAFLVMLALENGHVTARMLADVTSLSIARAHEIINQYTELGLLKISCEGRTKIAKLVGNWKQVLDKMISTTKEKFKERLVRYLAGYRLDRDIFWQWVETTVQGWKWLGVHSGLVRLST